MFKFNFHSIIYAIFAQKFKLINKPQINQMYYKIKGVA